MNCITCTVDIRENPGTCKDIFTLFSSLGIPMQERVILWNMALENISCTRFRDILSAVIDKTKGING